MKKRIAFMTGTRADFGKMKSLMLAVQHSAEFESQIFVTGMHMLSRYGMTVDEIHKAGIVNLHTFINQISGEPMEMVLANTIHGLSRYVHEYRPDLLVVHGDRVEALAGAIVGAMRNILVAHIEGGELSGTIDELTRHSISKMSHLHFVANAEAAQRLYQMGESPESVYVIGSPDIDVMLSDELPALEQVRAHYEIGFDDFAIAMLHPVSTKLANAHQEAEIFVSALVQSGLNYVVIYPNNDEGCNFIFDSYRRLESDPRFRLFPSVRFESFLSLLKNASFIIGNSSAGIREAPVYGIPCVNIGSRQQQRFLHPSIIQADFSLDGIAAAITAARTMTRLSPCHHFGHGDSAAGFMSALASESLWGTSQQKQFRDYVVQGV